eukprot:1058806-Prorocentrum_minimum.AAC.1
MPAGPCLALLAASPPSSSSPPATCPGSRYVHHQSSPYCTCSDRRSCTHRWYEPAILPSTPTLDETIKNLRP